MADSHERVPHQFRPDAAEKRKQGDMRDMVEAKCLHCGYVWISCVVGCCPRCHKVGAAELSRKMIGVPRV